MKFINPKRGFRNLLLWTLLTPAAVYSSDSGFDKELDLWKKSPPKQVFIDNECKVSGTSSIRLENGGTLERYFTLKPKTHYELTFYVKGKDIAAGGNNGGRIMLFD
ncbi:MAG: hypothetical protein J5858_08530, partial [Lentisphaeria bacterium]|nr:hypothetical protein [Lentisphaeria bacterium]